MKIWMMVAMTMLLGVGAAQAVNYDDGVGDVSQAANLEESFRIPPDSAKPHTWWHWMNGNVTRQGITADLEAMARVGIGGFQAFDVTDRTPAGPVGYMSDEWRELMKHAIQEADRLGLEMCLHNCAGWSSSGGPWITPDYAMYEVVSSESQLQGSKKISVKLEQPPTRLDYYRDIAVLAFRTPKNDNLRIPRWNIKAGYKKGAGVPPDTHAVDNEDNIKTDQIIDLSKYMDKAGQLNWKAPAGKWTIVRFGYTPTGIMNHPAPEEGLGLECDKLNPEAAEFHWKHSMKKVIDDVGPLAGKVFNNVLIDSWEVKNQNWTHRFADEFKKRRGYDLTPYLPCLTGRIVDSLEISERFLWDFRRTIADLFGDYYFGHFKKMSNRNNMALSIEPYGGGNFDNFTAARFADIPMGEIWAHKDERWCHSSSKLASSAAHAYGRRFVGAEAFPAGGADVAWVNHPYLLKSQGDYFLCKGVNRFIFHTFVHHPRVDVKPGITMGPHGFQFSRVNTWWEPGKAWMKYFARSQYMLQEGRQVADIFYLPGEHAPNSLKLREKLRPHIPYGYDYDACSDDVVMRMKVKDGRLVLPSGMSYKILVLLPGPSMRPELLKKIRDLAKDGATVVGTKPTKSPSLQNYPKCDMEVQKLAKDINWNKSLLETLAELRLKPDFEFAGAEEVSDTLYSGNGIEYIHRKIDDSDVYFVSNQHQYPKVVDCIFRVQGMMPELWHPDTGEIEPVHVYSATDDGRTMVQLRMDPAGSVFVVFRKPAPADSIVSIKPAPASIKIMNGKAVLAARKPGRYEMKTATGKTILAEIKEVPGPVKITGPWQLSFPENWGAPPQVELNKLVSWHKHENEGVRFFSGTAVYFKEFNLNENLIRDDISLILDLGDVQVIAQVKLNGKELGTLWKPPFTVNISDTARKGKNELQIKVTNLWPNRLIGDEQYEDPDQWNPPLEENPHMSPPGGKGLKVLPEWYVQGKPRPQSKRYTWTTWKFYNKDSELLPSGLLGPVEIVAQVEKAVSLK
jgi:hypothetical protein